VPPDLSALSPNARILDASSRATTRNSPQGGALRVDVSSVQPFFQERPGTGVRVTAGLGGWRESRHQYTDGGAARDRILTSSGRRTSSSRATCACRGRWGFGSIGHPGPTRAIAVSSALPRRSLRRSGGDPQTLQKSGGRWMSGVEAAGLRQGARDLGSPLADGLAWPRTT
jgi:hypothetical protein